MNKFHSAALSILLILSFILAGCGDSSTMTSSTKTPSSTTSPPAVSTTTPPTALQDTPPPAVIPEGPLLFPADSYTVKTKTVDTSEGEKEVTYHLYEYLTYVENPVDADYQSMNVCVPVNIDGVDIDATDAPIYLEVIASAYLSSETGSRRTRNANTDLALAAGYVLVSPGCRGWEIEAEDGTYYGKAPAVIVDLKCAVKYIRYNDAVMPGNAEWIIAAGISGGGAMSALLGASGNSDLYDAYFEELGAADADDDVFACAPYCPITDLEHADIAYEWEFGAIPFEDELVDQTLSSQLINTFTGYQTFLNLEGKNGFGTITAANYADYLLQTYLVPSASQYLSALTDTDRADYLAENTWITWANDTASFTWADYVAHVGRSKGLPAFDDFNLEQAENKLFGDETTYARHFTDFSLRYASGDDSAEIDSDLPTTLDLMNPMDFIGQNNSDCADYWWIRHGTCDSDTSLPVIINLATSLENLGKDVNTLLYWDTGHGRNEDPEDFIVWVGSITGYTG